MTDPAFLAADAGLGTPAADVDFSLELMERLLAAQHPDLAGLPLQLAASGWDNWMVRIGPTYCARMPRRAVAAILLAAEQAHLARLAQHLPVAIPVPVRAGLPGEGYPYAWSIVEWIEGQTVSAAPLRADQGSALAAFLKALHTQPTEGLPANPSRNGSLAGFDAGIGKRVDDLRHQLPWIDGLVEEVWNPALQVIRTEPAVCLHGDLHARNVLSRNGALVAVIDWGDMTCDDPMFDLAAVWLLLHDRSARQAALEAYGASSALVIRARAWALRIAMLLVDTPDHAASSLATLTAIGEDV